MSVNLLTRLLEESAQCEVGTVMNSLMIDSFSLITLWFCYRFTQSPRAEDSLPARRILNTTGKALVNLFPVAISTRERQRDEQPSSAK